MCISDWSSDVCSSDLSSLTRKGLAKLRANERLATQTKSGTDFQRLGGRIVFWIIFLVALVGALGILRIDGVTGPLSGMLNTLVPAIVLGVVAGLVATRSEEHTSDLQSLRRTSYAVFCCRKKRYMHKKTVEYKNIQN